MSTNRHTSGGLIVVKLGGAEGNDHDATLDDIGRLAAEGECLLVVHGGSAATDELCRARGIEPRMVTSPSGHVSRHTDRPTLEAFATATAGVNRSLVEGLQRRGVDAFGLSGLDGRAVVAERKSALRVVEDGRVRILRDGWTGRPTSTNVGLFRALQSPGRVLVVAPLAVSAQGEALNVDGDRLAARIAADLGAEATLFLTAVPGVLASYPDPDSIVRHIPADETPAWTERVEGRMKKKLLAAGEALDGGVPRVVIAASGGERPVAHALAGGGTWIGADQRSAASAQATAESSESSEDLARRELELGAGFVRPRALALVTGEGATLMDAEGRRYIDAAAGHGAASLGHAHPRLTEALSAQAARLGTCTTSFASDVRAQYLTELAEVLPLDAARVFLCNSGTEAVEAALKLARLSTGRERVVSLRRGFHGRTLGSLATTWERRYRAPFQGVLAHTTFVQPGDLEALEAALDEGVAALLLEPVQGEGGVHPLDPEYVAAASRLARERGALVIADEVQTGFGRTGRWFACEHYGLTPDIIALAKGMAGGFPVGAAAFGTSVTAPEPGAHGSTFGGNPLACAAGRATLQVLREEGLVEHARELGEHLLAGLSALDAPVIRAVRGLGLMVGVELRVRARAVLQQLQDQGVIALPAGSNVVRFLPPLTVTRAEIDQLIDRLERALRASSSPITADA